MAKSANEPRAETLRYEETIDVALERAGLAQRDVRIETIELLAHRTQRRRRE
jgi:hypothetical protein